MSRRGDNIWHRKDGRWEARYVKDRINGRAVYGYVYGKTYKEAKEKQVSKIKETESGKLNPCRRTMGEIFELYLNNRKYSVKDSTYAKYQRDINNHLKPYWSNVFLKDVDGMMIERFTDHLLNHGNINTYKGLSPKTVKDLIVLLKSIILYANQRDLCAISTPYISTPKVKKASIQTLSRDEQHILENYLYQDPDLTKMGVLLTLYTGLRLGELCALQWKNIDMKNQILYIDKTVQRITDKTTDHSTRIIFDTPKSDSSIRSIPIYTGIFNYLKDLFYCKNNSDNDFFLTGDEKYIEPRNMYRKYQTYLNDCGLPHYTFHCLRHTFATRAIECGFDPKCLSEILGHSNVKITLDRYVHPDFELKRNRMELLSKIAHF
jgi:integrase